MTIKTGLGHSAPLTITEINKKKLRRLNNRMVPEGPKGRQGAKKPRKTMIGLWREWSVPDGAYRRYKGLRGIYWYWLSRDVRQFEWEYWEGKCLTCLETVENWEDGQCGHIVASHGCGEYLRLNRANLTLQHAACNNPKITPMAAALNAIHFDQRYGQGAYQKLYESRKKKAKEPSQDEYRRLIRSLRSYQKSLI